MNLGLYSETVFHIGMDRNFVCLWRRHNCRSQVIDLSLSDLLIYESINRFIIGLKIIGRIITKFFKLYISKKEIKNCGFSFYSCIRIFSLSTLTWVLRFHCVGGC
jgi:hypothetical protein